MKTNKLFILFFFGLSVLISCNKDESSDDNSTRDEYYVIATIDGTEIEYVNAFADFTPIYSLWNNGSIYMESFSQNQDFPYVITISLFEENLTLGKHDLQLETSLSDDAHYFSIDEFTFLYSTEENVKSGSITITKIDRENNVLAGNFEFVVEITKYEDLEKPEVYDVSVESGSFKIKFPE